MMVSYCFPPFVLQPLNLCHSRRPVAQKVRDIGIWFDILETLGKHIKKIFFEDLIIFLNDNYFRKDSSYNKRFYNSIHKRVHTQGINQTCFCKTKK